MNKIILCAILAANLVTAQTNADVKAVYAKDRQSYTPLHIAAAQGQRNVVESLLSHKADVNAKSTDLLDTPLHLAAMYGHKDVAELLLANKAAVDATNSWERTPLHVAALSGHKDVVE